jgi:hypothetical protein
MSERSADRVHCLHQHALLAVGPDQLIARWSFPDDLQHSAMPPRQRRDPDIRQLFLIKARYGSNLNVCTVLVPV